MLPVLNTEQTVLATQFAVSLYEQGFLAALEKKPFDIFQPRSWKSGYNDANCL